MSSEDNKLLTHFSISRFHKSETHILCTVVCHHPDAPEIGYETSLYTTPHHILMRNLLIEEYNERRRLGKPLIDCDLKDKLDKGLE